MGSNVSEEFMNYLTGFKPPEMATGDNYTSKQNKIKIERQKYADTETLIRRFNLKKFDEVIKGLKVQSQNMNRLSINDEEYEAQLMGEFLFKTQGCDKVVKGYYFGQDKKKNILACTSFF